MLNTDDRQTAKVLIVDDLPGNLLALNALIRQDDRRIYEASCGEDALNLLLAHDFALAIVDVQMPGMSGFELAELMRGTEKTRHIPIVFVSAAGKELNYAFTGYETGAVDFLYKPLDVHAVKSKVNVFVELHHQRTETRRQVLALEKARQEQELLMRELQMTQGELRAALRMRDDFMAMAAHELRTPLNTLLLESHLRKMQLDRGHIALFDATHLQKMVANDKRQIQSMVRLIDDMLDVSRIRSNTLSIRGRPRSSCRHCWNAWSATLPIRQRQWAAASRCMPTSPPTACGTNSGLSRWLSNLLTNALRYGKGRPVEVWLTPGSDSVRIDVRDQGDGIALEDQQRIFEQFERAVDTGRDATGGLGLGLYITRQLVDAHGGSISVQSRPGEGRNLASCCP